MLTKWLLNVLFKFHHAQIEAGWFKFSKSSISFTGMGRGGHGGGATHSPHLLVLTNVGTALCLLTHVGRRELGIFRSRRGVPVAVVDVSESAGHGLRAVGGEVTEAHVGLFALSPPVRNGLVHLPGGGGGGYRSVLLILDLA